MRAETRGKRRECKPCTSGIGRFASPKTVLVIVQVGYCGWPPVVQGSTPRISHLINLDLHLWVHDKGTGAMLAEIPVPQNASGSETTDYLMPYGILRRCPLAGMLVAQLLEIPVGRRPLAGEQSRYSRRL